MPCKFCMLTYQSHLITRYITGESNRASKGDEATQVRKHSSCHRSAYMIMEKNEDDIREGCFASVLLNNCKIG